MNPGWSSSSDRTGDSSSRAEHGLWTALKCSFVGFMTHTSMHGLKYICEDGRRALERAFFLIAVSVSLIASVFMTTSIYSRYSSVPSINIEHTHYPSWRLPFPAVTICNTNRVMRSKAEAFVDQLRLPVGVNKMDVLEDLKLIGELWEPEFPADQRFQNLQKILDDNRFSIQNVMKDLGQNCREMFEKCSWKSSIVSCSELFDIRKSRQGFCCSFNYLWVGDVSTREKGSAQPRRDKAIHTRLYGQRMGLSLLINPMTYEYFVTSHVSSGLMLTIHDAQDFPDATGTAMEKMIPLEKEVMVPIMTSALYSSDSVRGVNPSDRKCIFSDERRLFFFTEYTYNNCITECKMNYSLALCACLPYYFPDNGGQRVCDLDDVQCLHEHYETLHTWRYPYESYSAGFPEDSMVCDCPAQCDHVAYGAEVSVGDFKAARHSVNPFFLTETNVTDRILLHVYLESNFARLYKRDTNYSWVDVLSSLGGVTSLCLGCSFVTLIEIAYFFTIRLRRKKTPVDKHQDCPFTAQHIRNLQVRQRTGAVSTPHHPQMLKF